MKEESETIGISFMKEVIDQQELLLESKIQRLMQMKAELIEIEKKGDKETVKLFIDEIEKTEADIKRSKQQIDYQKKQIALKC